MTDMERELELVQAIAKGALRQWRCTACGGKGTYHHNAKGTAKAIASNKKLDPKYNPLPVPCKICQGNGLNPIATKALADLAGVAAKIVTGEKET